MCHQWNHKSRWIKVIFLLIHGYILISVQVSEQTIFFFFKLLKRTELPQITLGSNYYPDAKIANNL